MITLLPGASSDSELTHHQTRSSILEIVTFLLIILFIGNDGSDLCRSLIY